VLAIDIILLTNTSRYLYACHAMLMVTVPVDKFAGEENRHFFQTILMYEYMHEAKLV
jgi:hypothetical protein